MMHVVLVTNLAPPYRLPIWDRIAERVDAFTVLLCARRQSNRPWEAAGVGQRRFDVEVLPGWSMHVRRMDWGIYLNPTILHRLHALRPTHVMVEGYESPSYLAAMAYAKVARIPLVTWWKSHAQSSRVKGGVIHAFRKRLLGASDAFLATGTPAETYLVDMGMRPDRIARAPNTIDVERLLDALPSLDPDPRHAGPVRCLYVGQFLERKGLDALLTAFGRIPPHRAELTLVGYGPEESALRARKDREGLDHVRFVGATRTLEETARFLADADLLVMPSKTEVWGLVVNEALVSGLYVVASDRAGCAQDLIDNAPTDVGATFDPLDVDDLYATLARSIDRVASGAVDRASIRAWGASHTPEAVARAAIESLRMATRPS